MLGRTMVGTEANAAAASGGLGIKESLSASKFGGSHVELSRIPPSNTGPTGRSGGVQGTGAPGQPGAQAPPMRSTKACCDRFWQHKHTTATLCCVFWSFGMCVAFLGPTLLDLGCKTSTAFSTMSWVFFSQSLFVLLGSACGGLLVNRFTPNVILLIGTATMTITMAIIPVCNVLLELATVLAVMGFFMGTIDTVANVSMVRIYGKDVPPFLQALHFFYGVGAFVSPMIAKPFLLNEDCSVFINGTAVEDITPIDNMPANSLGEAQEKTHVDYAFWIMALLMVPVVVMTSSLVLKQFFREKMSSSSGGELKPEKQTGQYESMDSAETNETSGTEEKGNGRQVTTFQVILITLLAAALMFLYDGLQAAYGGYVYSYAVKGPVKLQKSDEAAYLNALFWGMFAGGRLISIPLAMKLAPALMLLINILGCCLGMLLMLCMSDSKTMLFVGTCMMGAFMSSVFPTALSLTEQYVHVTPTITSILVFGAALGEMSMPVILGHEFHRAGPLTFLVTGMVLCVLSLIVYLALWVAGHSVIRYAAAPGILGLFSTCIPGKSTAETENSGLMTQHVRYYSRMRSDLSESSIGEQYGDSAFNE